MRIAPAATFWRRLATIGTPLLIIALVLTPLIIGTTWMYRASAEAFQFQHEVRVAQNARDGVMKLFLASEADVRVFAATNDSYFSAHHRAYSQSFASLSTALENSVRRVGVPGGVDIVLRESATYKRWTRDVAAPFLRNFVLKSDIFFGSLIRLACRQCWAMIANSVLCSTIPQRVRRTSASDCCAGYCSAASHSSCSSLRL